MWLNDNIIFCSWLVPPCNNFYFFKNRIMFTGLDKAAFTALIIVWGGGRSWALTDWQGKKVASSNFALHLNFKESFLTNRKLYFKLCRKQSVEVFPCWLDTMRLSSHSGIVSRVWITLLLWIEGCRVPWVGGPAPVAQCQLSSPQLNRTKLLGLQGDDKLSSHSARN